MYGVRYFPARFFPPRFWPVGSGTVIVSPDICWPLTVAIVNNNRTTIAISAIWKTMLETNSGTTTVVKGC